MKNVLSFMKKQIAKINVFESILIMIFVFFCFSTISHYDNDIWFILAGGKYISLNGIPHIEVFTFHTDYVLIMQQWLTCLIYYSTYKLFGVKVLTLLFTLISGLGLFMLYRYSYYLTKNKTISSIYLMFYTIFFLVGYTTSRPQIITYLILTSALFLSEKFYKTNNKKYLYLLPFLSLLEINLHASMWVLLICFVGVFLVDSFINKKNWHSYLITIIIMCLVSLINPYGIKAITYVLSSYEVSSLNNYISEMQPLEFNNFTNLSILLVLVLLIPLNRKTKEKLPIRYFFLLLGTLVLACSHMKSVPYLGMSLIIILSFLSSDIKLSDLFKNKFNKIINKTLKYKRVFVAINVSIFACACVTLCLGLYTEVHNPSMFNKMQNIVDYLDKNETNKDVKIYTSYEDGGYLEWRGYKPYIDARGDVFIKSNNKKFELMDEYYKAIKNDEFTLELMEKYQFDYLVLQVDSRMNKYIKNNKYKYYEKVVDESKTTGYLLYKRV